MGRVLNMVGVERLVAVLLLADALTLLVRLYFVQFIIA
jgi:hypothetical protein